MAVNVKELLASWCKDSSDKAAPRPQSATQRSVALKAIWARFLADIDVRSATGSSMSKDSVKSYVIMRARVLAASCDSLLEEWEDELGIEHQLAKTFVLERLCQMTKAESEDVQNQLLRWLFFDLRFSMRLKKIGRTVVVHRAKASVLGCRLLFYAVSKLRLSKSEAKAAGIECEDDHKKPRGFFSNFVSHENWEFSGLGDLASDNTWVAGLLPYQQEALPILQCQCACRLLAACHVADAMHCARRSRLQSRKAWTMTMARKMAWRKGCRVAWPTRSCRGQNLLQTIWRKGHEDLVQVVVRHAHMAESLRQDDQLSLCLLK